MEKKLSKKEKRELAKQQKRKELGRRGFYKNLKKFAIFFVMASFFIFLGTKVWKWFKTPAVDTSNAIFDVSENDWVKGDVSAEVTLIEYGDFQCPTCATYVPVIEELLNEIPRGWRLIYRQFPLTSIHANAFDAGRAAESAGNQNKFWEMYDVLYEKQKDWEELKNPKDKFLEYAKDLSLDENQFISDYDSKVVYDKINEDISSGNTLKINSTPSFFLNGEKIMPKSYDEFKKLIENNIQENLVK